MCARFSLNVSAEDLTHIFNVQGSVPSLPRRFNIAPSQEIAAIRTDAESGARAFAWLRWGLIPSWAKDKTIGAKTINARSETAAEKPAFRSAVKTRRCVIPATSYFEWTQAPGAKQPWSLHAKDYAVLAFAGLWERWKGPDGAVVESCSILTTEANDSVREVHDRMPVILEARRVEAWIDPRTPKPAELLAELRTESPALLRDRVSTLVNSPRNDVPECIAPIAGAPPAA